MHQDQVSPTVQPRLVYGSHRCWGAKLVIVGGVKVRSMALEMVALWWVVFSLTVGGGVECG